MHELRLEYVPMIFESGINVVNCPECGLLNPETLLREKDCSHCGADMSLPSLSKEPDSIGRSQWQVIQEMRNYRGENWYHLNKYMLRSKEYWEKYITFESSRLPAKEFNAADQKYWAGELVNIQFQN